MGIFRKELIKLSVIQMNIIQDEKELNIKRAQELIDEALRQEAKIVCLPEAFATGINWMSLRNMAEEIPDGNITKRLSKQAKDAEVYIIAGILEKEGSDIYDTAILLDSNGAFLGKHRRRFLWNGERGFISPGQESSKCIPTPMGKIGLLIGYEINFPEACREYFREQVDLLVCVATIFEDFSYPTEHLCRARAMENHCYFVFASGLGEHQLANKRFMGKSLIACDPMFLINQGFQADILSIDILSQAEKNEGILIQTLLLEDLIKSKKKIPQYHDLEAALNIEKGG